ncbi:SCO family protein [Bacteroidota bacterium]
MNYTKNSVTPLFIMILSFLLIVNITAQNKQIEVGIDEQLGAYLPLELKFQNSRGDTMLLDEVIDRPVLLALVYYECPGICSPLLTELAWSVDKLQMEPLEDFKVVTLSFNHRETPEIAASWKRNYLASMKREFPDEAWLFLTGDSISIHKLTDAAGFHFIPSEQDFIHAGSVIAISPDGKISRYLFGTTFNPFDLKMALIDAQAGKTNPTIAKVLQFCFSFDPEGRKYTLNITRIIGSIMLLTVGIFFAVLVIRKKKK